MQIPDIWKEEIRVDENHFDAFPCKSNSHDLALSIAQWRIKSVEIYKEKKSKKIISFACGRTHQLRASFADRAAAANRISRQRSLC